MAASGVWKNNWSARKERRAVRRAEKNCWGEERVYVGGHCAQGYGRTLVSSGRTVVACFARPDVKPLTTRYSTFDCVIAALPTDHEADVVPAFTQCAHG